jgi:predicted NAD/FAD-dependent oxidoreductase
VFSGVRYDSTFVGIYKVPRFAGKWFAVKGDRDANIAWISAEERKAPERVDPEFSLLIVHASADWSRKLIAEKEREAVHELWLEVRKVLPELPEKPISQTWKKWNVSALASAPISTPGADANFRWPTKPKDLPFALAGDYVGGPTLEDAARSGHDAAQQLIAQLPRRRRNPLLKIHIGQ